MLTRFLSEDFALTKRHLSAALILAGLLVGIGIPVSDALQAEPDGFGTLQQIGTLLALASLLIGVTLWPLGDQPA
ncbi:MAG: hypothetical protein GX573_07795 [Chloroflexi bacterium]|nr:hypothetical protein [Chloroflexota bacterium]